MSASGPPSSSPQRRRGGGSVASGKSRRSVDLVAATTSSPRSPHVARRRAGGRHRRPRPQRRAGHRASRRCWSAQPPTRPASGRCGRSASRATPCSVMPGCCPCSRHCAACSTRCLAAQAAALADALGWSSADQPPAPLLVAAATLALLSAAAAERPLLVVVDDAHWLDHESASALLFAVRRMREDPVMFLLAARAESPAAYELADLPTLSLGGLSGAQVREHWPELVPDVAARLAAETLGNPLVLGDVVPLLSAAQRAGAAPLPDPLPVGARPLGSLSARLTDLSPDARHLVLLHACGGPGEARARAGGGPRRRRTDRGGAGRRRPGARAGARHRRLDPAGPPAAALGGAGGCRPGRPPSGPHRPGGRCPGGRSGRGGDLASRRRRRRTRRGVGPRPRRTGRRPRLRRPGRCLPGAGAGAVADGRPGAGSRLAGSRGRRGVRRGRPAPNALAGRASAGRRAGAGDQGRGSLRPRRRGGVRRIGAPRGHPAGRGGRPGRGDPRSARAGRARDDEVPPRGRRRPRSRAQPGWPRSPTAATPINGCSPTSPQGGPRRSPGDASAGGPAARGGTGPRRRPSLSSTPRR